MSPNIFLFLERILELLASSHADQNRVRVSRTDLPSAPLQGRNINNNHTQQIYKPIAQRPAPIPNLQTEMAEQKGRTLYATIMTCYNERPLSQPEVPLSLSLCVCFSSFPHSFGSLQNPTTPSYHSLLLSSISITLPNRATYLHGVKSSLCSDLDSEAPSEGGFKPQNYARRFIEDFNSVR